MRDDVWTPHSATGHQICMSTEVYAAGRANQWIGAEKIQWRRGRRRAGSHPESSKVSTFLENNLKSQDSEDVCIVKKKKNYFETVIYDKLEQNM